MIPAPGTCDWVDMVMDRLHRVEAALERQTALRKDSKLILCKDPTTILCGALRALLLSRIDHEVALDYRQQDPYKYLRLTVRHAQTGATTGTPSFRFHKLTFCCDRANDLPTGTFSGEEIDSTGLVDRLMGSEIWHVKAIWAHDDLLWADREHYDVQPHEGYL